MKWKTKKIIAYDIAKEFWNKSSADLRIKMVRDYIGYLNVVCQYDSPYKLKFEDYIKLAECDWKGIPLYKCNLEASDIRTSVCFHLKIGIYESYREISGNLQYQREYTLRTLGIS